jgi:hypothetical protein
MGSGIPLVFQVCLRVKFLPIDGKGSLDSGIHLVFQVRLKMKDKGPHFSQNGRIHSEDLDILRGGDSTAIFLSAPADDDHIDQDCGKKCNYENYNRRRYIDLHLLFLSSETAIFQGASVTVDLFPLDFLQHFQFGVSPGVLSHYHFERLTNAKHGFYSNRLDLSLLLAHFLGLGFYIRTIFFQFWRLFLHP